MVGHGNADDEVPVWSSPVIDHEVGMSKDFDVGYEGLVSAVIVAVVPS